MLRDVRGCPGTYVLAGSWVLVFALILLVQWWTTGPRAPGPWFEPLPVSTVTSHRFGDLTWSDFRRGEAWRLETATFIHFGLIHLTLNVLGLINLGRLIEPWYRTGPFLLICLAIGALGNLAGVLIRQGVAAFQPWLGASAMARAWPGVVDRIAHAGLAGPVNVHTGGGSTILLGLLGLGAVVGWRSKTRIGVHFRKQMLIILGLTALLGIVLYNLVDNYGHLGGTLVGAAIGLLDRPIVRLSKRKPARRLAWAGVAVVVLACTGSAIRDDRAEAGFQQRLGGVFARYRAAESTLSDLERVYLHFGRTILRSPAMQDPLYEFDALAIHDLFARGPAILGPANRDPEQLAREARDTLASIERIGQVPAGSLWGESVADDLARVRALGSLSLEDFPTYDKAYEFVVCYRSAFKAIAADLGQSRAALVDLDRQSRSGW